MPGRSRYAIVCYVMGKGVSANNYTSSALVLAHTLRQHNTRAHLVVMVTPDITKRHRENLKLLFDRVVPVEYLRARTVRKESKRFGHMYAWLDNCFTKFHALSLTDYEKVLLLDADMVALACPDELFDLQAPAGNCAVITTAEDNRNCHGREVPPRAIKDALNDYGIRGCLWLLRPDAGVWRDVQSQVIGAGAKGIGDPKRRIGPDELFAIRYWQKWTHVHIRFCATGWKLKELKGDTPVMLHYVTEKPWDSQSKDYPDYKYWFAGAVAVMQKFPITSDLFTHRVREMVPGARTTRQIVRERMGAKKRLRS
eukprot:UC1_evm1s1783